MSENSAFRAPEGAGDVPVVADATDGEPMPAADGSGGDADVFDGAMEAEVSRRLMGLRRHGLDGLPGR